MKTVGDRLRDPTWRRYGSYAFDWILCIVLIAVFLYLDSVNPFHREFSVQNPAIMYSYRPTDSVPAWALIVISVAVPVVLILLIGLGIRRSPYDVHNGVLGLLVSVLLTTMITQVIKVTVGKHRPDFLARCIPMLNGVQLTHDEPLSLWTVDVCTQTDKSVLQEGMRSFPSGHASSALLIAISRIRDYRHSGVDVTWGSITGIIFAVFAYFQYYPSLAKATSHVPHPPRDFSQLVKDTEGHVHEAGHIEQFTGIERNEEFVDESRVSPLPVTANGVGIGDGKGREDPLQRV
ncbi:hypothetical protein BG006_006785 [Podila minutissima]|uniref:Phosphatidic acid phosphatase type 2/haloperoxidase domain-containing protein n=1 Tax=Podila minutissima TaxID=64525 RepID=A0A9P5SMK0_9FUNG|nr:hypothetical protein BG006_006785 [Podila minutissima]